MRWTFNGHDAAFDGDGYLHFERANPYLPTVGFGFNPSIRSLHEDRYRPEDSILADNLGLAASQDRSLVLAWNSLPDIGIARIRFLNFAIGHDENPAGGGSDTDEYNAHPDVTDNSRSMIVTLGLRPLGGAEDMGGVNMSTFQYEFAYESLRNAYDEGASVLRTAIGTKRVRLANLGTARGDHSFVGHGLLWDPFRSFGLAAHYIDWKADDDGGVTADLRATEWRVAARVWLWSPQGGMISGSEAEGGIATSPMYSVVDLKDTGDGNPIGEVKHMGWAIHYFVPGGWLQIHGIWDRYECDEAVCHPDVALVSDNGKSFNTFTVVAQYRF